MHFMNLLDFSPNQISHIFNIADKLQENKVGNILDGRTFALFFPESSIRTRITFEKGIKDLGAECILFPSASLDKKEKLVDVIGYLNNWVDAIVIRHSDFNKMIELSKHSTIPIINAMSSENHPCEILSDIYSIRKMHSEYRKLTYTFVGPAGNIVKSWTEISKLLDLRFFHVCNDGNRLCEDNHNYHFTNNLEKALIESDVVLTDSLPDEYQNEEYISNYQITLQRMKMSRDGAIINPCPPFFRDQEIDDDVINSDYFVGYGFKKNLIYVQQALIIHCLGLFKEGADIL